MTDGLLILFTPANANTSGAANLTINGIGPNNIVNYDTNNESLTAGQLSNTSIAFLVWSAEEGTFILLNPSSQPYASINSVQHSLYNYAADTGTANHYVVDLVPAAALTDGLLVVFQPAHTNTGPASFINVNGAGEVLITTIYNDDVSAGDLTTNNVAVLIYSNSSGGFQLLNPTNAPFAVRAQVASGFYNLGTDTGAADAYVISSNIPLGSYHDGQVVAFTPTHNNATATPTMNVDGNGPKTMTTSSAAVPLSAGQVSTTQLCYCVYSLAADVFLVLTTA